MATPVKRGTICRSSQKITLRYLKWYVEAKKRENLCRSSSGKNCDLRGRIENTSEYKDLYTEHLQHLSDVCGRDAAGYVKALAKERLPK
jgi:hypothetical protein